MQEKYLIASGELRLIHQLLSRNETECTDAEGCDVNTLSCENLYGSSCQTLFLWPPLLQEGNSRPFLTISGAKLLLSRRKCSVVLAGLGCTVMMRNILQRTDRASDLILTSCLSSFTVQTAKWQCRNLLASKIWPYRSRSKFFTDIFSSWGKTERVHCPILRNFVLKANLEATSKAICLIFLRRSFSFRCSAFFVSTCLEMELESAERSFLWCRI